MRDAHQDIRARGGELFVIGNGPPYFAEIFKSDLKLEAPLYTDPSLETYRAAELNRGVAATVGLGALKNAFGAFRQGFRQTGTKGDPWQLGGVLVVSPDGRVLYRQASEVAGDHPPVEAVMTALTSNRSSS